MLILDEEGNELIISSVQGEVGTDLAIEKSKVFNLKGKPITFGVKGNSNTNTTYSDLIKTDNGEVFAIGQRVVKKDVPVRNEDGTIKLDDKKRDVTRVEEQVIDVVESDPKILNNIARQIENQNGDKLENLNELTLFLDSRTEELNTKNVKKEETKEERIKRLREAINN